MKLNGEIVRNDIIEYVVIPRQTKNLVFKFKPVLKTDEFDNYVKKPEPPKILLAGQTEASLDFEDEDYKKKLFDYVQSQYNWMFLQSIKATEDIEWETVKDNDPATWGNYAKELLDSGFSTAETNMIVAGFNKANALDEKKLEAARASFLATMGQV